MPHPSTDPAPGRPPGPLLALLALLALAGCADEDQDAREAWLRDTLIADNQRLIERDPPMVAGKLLKMTLDPTTWLRGTQPQFLRDMVEPGSGVAPTALGTRAGARVMLIGDPHLENIGTYLNAQGELLVDFNDFDAATWGLWVHDVRRLALSAWLVGAQLDPRDPALPTEMALAVARGYQARIEATAQGAPPLRLRRDEGGGVILEDLLRRAARDGQARRELEDYTAVEADRRVMRLGELEPGPLEGVYGDTTLALTPQEEALVERAIGAWRQENPAAADAGAVKGACRRLGVGVGSYPLWRFHVLLEGPTEALDDDALVELKEVADPTPIPGLRVYPDRIADDNARRVVLAQRAMQEGPDNDPLLGQASVGPIPMRVRDRSFHQRGLSVERMARKLAEGEWGRADLLTLAGIAGELLARAHAQAPTLNGGTGLAPISEALSAHPDTLQPEIEAFTAEYGPRTLADLDRARALIDRHGPLLGYRPGGRP